MQHQPHSIKPRYTDPSTTGEDLTCAICKNPPPECFSKFYQCMLCNEVGVQCQPEKPDFSKVVMETPPFGPKKCVPDIVE
jgi:hypothetical protein